MTRADLTEYWDALRAARYWARATKQPLLRVLCSAVQGYLDFEQSPHCEHCDSADVFVNEGTYSTGVVAPDGVHERVYSMWLQCRRCGGRSELQHAGQ